MFECWLHPARYRTQPCKDGRNCKRRVCFFSHTPEQLRHLPSISSPQVIRGASRSALALALHASAVKNSLSASYDGSPWRQLLDGLVDSSNHAGDSGSHYFSKAVLSSPTSTLVEHSQSPLPLSPPLSPLVSPPELPNAWINCVNSWNSVSVNCICSILHFLKKVLLCVVLIIHTSSLSSSEIIVHALSFLAYIVTSSAVNHESTYQTL